MNVVLYLRYSSDKQTEQSIEGQDRVCTAWCEQQGYTIVNRYIDRATSASKHIEKRTQFAKMIADSNKRRFEAVVVYKLDRFARNRYDSATYKAKLKQNGVKVLSATENLSDNPESIILEAVLEGMAEFYSKELAQKVTRGMRVTALKCHSTGGPIPLGYEIRDKKFVIKEDEAQIVREAFDLYANGHTVTEICNIFNTKGYRTKKGTEFNKNSFVKMFKNERYIGTYKYMDVKIENGIPAIIDKGTFADVQKRLKSQSSAPGRAKAKVDYLLAGKLFCGHCGSLMTGESGRGEYGGKYYYYTCSDRKKHRKCDKKPLRKEYIERLVVQDALELLTPEMIDTLADMAISATEDDIANDTVVPALRDELRETEKSLGNLLKLIERGVESESVDERIRELEDQKKALLRRIEDAESEYVVLEKDHIVWWLTKFTQGDIEDEEFRRHIIDLLINSVTVWDEPDGYKITTLYNLNEGNSKTYRVKSSDFNANGSPKKTYPNFIFLYGRVFGYTKRHLR